MPNLTDRLTKLEERLHAKGASILASELHAKEQVIINADVEKRLRALENSATKDKVILGGIVAAIAVGGDWVLRKMFG